MKKLILSFVILLHFSSYAQLTSTQLKNQIDTQITNKIGVSSITKQAVGGNMKAIVDFVVDQVSDIPAGAQGPVGPQGPQGIQGIQGVAGTSPVLPLEYVVQIYQTGTDDVILADPIINTITQGTAGATNFRDVTITRVFAGEYRVRIIYKTAGFVNSNKCVFYPSDKRCKIIASSSGNDGTNNYKEWVFATYNDAGTKVDGQLTGGNGGYFNIKIYN